MASKIRSIKRAKKKDEKRAADAPATLAIPKQHTFEEVVELCKDGIKIRPDIALRVGMTLGNPFGADDISVGALKELVREYNRDINLAITEAEEARRKDGTPEKGPSPAS